LYFEDENSATDSPGIHLMPSLEGQSQQKIQNLSS